MWLIKINNEFLNNKLAKKLNNNSNLENEKIIENNFYQYLIFEEDYDLYKILEMSKHQNVLRD